MSDERRTWRVLLRAYRIGWDLGLVGLAILAAWAYDALVSHRGTLFVIGAAVVLWLAVRLGLTLGWMAVSALLGGSRRGARPPD